MGDNIEESQGTLKCCIGFIAYYVEFKGVILNVYTVLELECSKHKPSSLVYETMSITAW